jgi:nicotinic acid mononucleotide adenylyltransferase
MMEESLAHMPEAWNARYRAAASALDDTAYLVGITRRIRTLSTSGAAAEFFGGEVEHRRVGSECFFAGTFNPLTLAHIALVEAAEGMAGVDHVIWVLAVASVDKESTHRATLLDRLVHLLAYVKTVTGSSVVLVNRGLYVEQVRLLRPYLPAGSRPVVLVGFDKIVQIFDPHYYEDRSAALDELFAEARFAVAPRGEAGRAELEALLSRPENVSYRDDVSYLSVPPRYSEDSATTARRLSAESEASARTLGSILPPEGVALALTTGAYGISADALHDAYAWRNAWIAALTAALPPTPLGPSALPRMRTLCEAAMDVSRQGEQIRSALAADPPDSQLLLSLLGGV